MLGILILVTCLLLGEFLAMRFSGWLSSAIAGFLCLFIFLSILDRLGWKKEGAPLIESLRQIEKHLLPHFTFFLLPVVTGTWFFWSSYPQGVLGLMLILTLSTLLVMLCIGGLAQFFFNKEGKG